MKTNPLISGISHLMEVDAVRSIAWVLFLVSGLYLVVVILLGTFENGQLPVVLIIWVPTAIAFSLMAHLARHNRN